MDRNTIIGFLLIAVIVVGFSLLNKPSEEEIAQQRRYNDSIALVQQARIEAEVAVREATEAMSVTHSEDTVAKEEIESKLAGIYGAFSVSAIGEDAFYTLENEKLRVKISSKGGRVYSAELKEYRTHDSLPLFLFDGEKESSMNFTLITNNNRIIQSSEMFFAPVSGVQTDSNGNQTIIMRLNTTMEDAYLDMVYTLPTDDYMLAFSIVPHNMNLLMPAGTNVLEMQWASKIRQQEKGRKFEERYTQLEFRFAADDDVERLSESKNDDKRVNQRVKWIAYKNQFFSSILIADNPILSANLQSRMEGENTEYLKSYASDMVIPFDATGKEPTSFYMYFGPNHHQTLASYDKGVEKGEKLYLRKLIPVGWSVIGWVNLYFIIPMFNIFRGFVDNMGVVILLLTLLVKLIIFPMTYKSYMSSAKMRVLKPEIDAINARIPADKPAERQKATMDLYSKVGVSPMSGCLPMLLQFPILIAMFSFFPAAIELRQESFLWAKDLSTYDAIISWDFNIPIISGILGNHISLFCVLMTITTILSNKLNTATTAVAGDQMKMMKIMMNIMPIMLFFIFNNYASGLTYYYFLSTLITVAQNYIIRATVNEEKLLAELHAKGNAKKNNPKKKTGFMERLEKMQREQQKAIQQQNKNKRK